MKLEPNDPPFSGLPLHFESVLPPSGVINGAISPLFASLNDADLASRVLENSNTIAAQLGRSIAGGIGWPETQLDDLASLVSTAFDRIPAPEIAKVIASAAKLIPEALAEVQRAVTDTISGVPLLGWVVKLGMLVWEIVQVARARAPELGSAVALGYDRDDDSYATDGLIARTSASDWTDLFLPPLGPLSTITLAYTASGIKDGLAWGQIGQVSERLGLIPGVGQIAGYWQTPRAMPGSTRPAGIESIVTGNRLYPSATSFAALLWSNAQKGGSPTLGAIDLDKIADAWAAYGEAIEAFASSQGPWEASQIRNGWAWYVPGLQPGTTAGLYGFNRDDAPKEWRGPGLEALVGWRVARARERVRKGLSTLSCAYMGPDTPALRDAALREQWAKMRAILLTHPARAQVDLTMVPDADYRSALAAAQKSASGDLKAPEKPKPPRWPMPGGGAPKPPTVDGSPSPPEPEPPALPDPPGWPTGGDGEGGGAGAIAVAVLLVLALRARSRRG